MINIFIKNKERLIHLVIESFFLFIGGSFISYYINSLFPIFNKDIYEENKNENKLYALLLEVFIQLTMLVLFAVFYKDFIKNILFNILDHTNKNVSMLSNIPYTPSLFMFQENLLEKLRYINSYYVNKINNLKINH